MSYNSRGNRGGRGRRGSWIAGKKFNSKPAPSPGRNIVEEIGPFVKTLSIPAIDNSDAHDVTISDLNAIASYNWVESTRPTIIVPGSPPVWRQKELPLAVRPDSGRAFVDQNAFRCPDRSLTPLVAAVLHHKPDFDLSSIDIVTDRRNFARLLEWVQGANDSALRIDLELAGKRTVLFSRWENLLVDDIAPGFPYKYGQEFKTAMTEHIPECAETTGHYRIISYNLHGIKVLLRYAVDAIISAPRLDKSPPTVETPSVDSLTDRLSAVSLGNTSSPSKPAPDLTIIDGGSLAPQTSIIETKTRSQRNFTTNFKWEDFGPQLFLSRTPNMFVGVHERGTFTSIEKEQFRSLEMREVTREAQGYLKKMVCALQDIVDLVRKEGNGRKLSLIYQDGVMKLYERSTGREALPTEFMLKF